VTARTLFAEPYLSSGEHEGILLHSIYHQPNGWDFVQPGQTVANGESCMWGDYHLLELAVMIDRAARGGRYQRFFDIRGTV
jgi:unsaturated chondroitin disaccharide hydrolase